MPQEMNAQNDAAQAPVSDPTKEAAPAKDGDKGSKSVQKGQLAGPIQTSDESVNAIQKNHPGGLELVIYGPTTKEMAGGYKDNTNNREFTTQAKGHAEIHKTVAATGGDLKQGAAMMALSKVGVEGKITTTYDRLMSRYKAAKPEGAPETPESLKIKSLALYYHGGSKQLYMPGSDLKASNVDDFVASVGYTLRNDVNVQLFACNSAKGEGSLAESMAGELGGGANVLGHTSAAHTTENSDARVFGTLGDGVHMLDVMFPPAFQESELLRIWGPIEDPAKQAEARASLHSRLKNYYRRVFGLLGGWNEPAKKAFENANVQQKGYYASKGLKVPGREMFRDPIGMSQEAQTRWMTWAAQNEAARFGKVAPLSADFTGGGGQTVEPQQGQNKAPRNDTPPAGGGGKGGGGAAKESVSINATKAAAYNRTRLYSEIQWTGIQKLVDTEPDGDPGPNTARAVAAWQKQNGLVADGYVGPKTFEKMKQALGAAKKPEELPDGEQGKADEAPAAPPPDGNVTANFSWNEFASRDGVPVPAKYKDNVISLCQQLEVLRAQVGGASIRVNSGYRSPNHNKKVGGASKSQHLVGKASDIAIEGMTQKKVKSLIESLIKQGRMKQGGIGLYNTFVHYDIRGSAARW